IKIMEELSTDDLVRRNASHVTFLNIGTGEDQTIAEIALLIKAVTGFIGEIHWDNSKPDGTFKKLLDVSRLIAMGWLPSYSLQGGIAAVYGQYVV
ncbi:MAG: GDP-L-fucose synthase, partial [Bacteroidota bacterium]